MKINLKAYSLFFLFAFISSVALQAQQNTFKKGTVVLSRKKTIEAYILVDFAALQNFQKEITYDNNHYGAQAVITGEVSPWHLTNKNVANSFVKMLTEYNGS